MESEKPLNYGVIIPAREEIAILRQVLESVAAQTCRPEQIILVDDGCDGDVEGLCRLLGVEYHRFPIRHRESWAGKPELALVFNYGLQRLYRGLDWFMILGSDTVLEKRYVEKVIRGMVERGLVIGSGNVVGEKSDAPRGSGRIFAAWFWRQHIGKFPTIYAWESYPLYKAMAMGYRIGVVEDASMRVLRPTRNYKPFYGYAMRELGYHPVYALGRIAMAMRRDPATALKMLQTYLRGSGYRLEDKALKRFVKGYQSRRILEYLTHPESIFRRIMR